MMIIKHFPLFQAYFIPVAKPLTRVNTFILKKKWPLTRVNTFFLKKKWLATRVNSFISKKSDRRHVSTVTFIQASSLRSLNAVLPDSGGAGCGLSRGNSP